MAEEAKVSGLCLWGTQAIPPPGKGREVAGPGHGLWPRERAFLASIFRPMCLSCRVHWLPVKKTHLRCILANLSSHGGRWCGERTWVSKNSAGKDNPGCLLSAQSTGDQPSI